MIPSRTASAMKMRGWKLFGLPLIALPGFSHPADDRGGSGLLIPDIQYSRTNGFELSIPVYFKTCAEQGSDGDAARLHRRYACA
jgi:LPS-assembly protein